MDPSVSLILYLSFKVDVYNYKHSKPWLVNFRGSRSCNQSEPTVYRIYLSNLNPLIMYCDSCGDLDDSLCGTLPKQLSPRDPLFSSLLQSSSCNTNSEIPAHHKLPFMNTPTVLQVSLVASLSMCSHWPTSSGEVVYRCNSKSTPIWIPPVFVNNTTKP